MKSVGELTETLRRGSYLADRGLATAAYVALSLRRPLLLEGEVGVGKTEIAKVLAAVLGRDLIRLQCYEGIDTGQALYEWDYARQLLHIRASAEPGHQLSLCCAERGILVEMTPLKATFAVNRPQCVPGVTAPPRWRRLTGRRRSHGPEAWH